MKKRPAPSTKCEDFAVTHARWEKDGAPYTRRMTEQVRYCPHHFGIAFPGYHISTTDDVAEFECTYCGCTFNELQAAEADKR